MKTIFKQVKNEVTGKIDLNFGAKLVSLNTTTPYSFKNAKNEEKVYYLGTVDFVYPNGTIGKGVTTQIFKTSVDKGVEVGSTLLSTMTRDDSGRVWLRTSSAIAGNGIDVAAMGSMFDEMFDEDVAAVATNTGEFSDTPPALSKVN